uniref:Innexin n=2 Tax=Hirudo TaxID=6420 RepID=Q38HR0_HIRME|nr:innexin 11 [Hirudo medicinalis]AFC34069.1 INX9B [Hirudo verbana]
MDKLFDIFGGVSQTKLGGGDSFTDQLSCKYTVYILSLVVILSTTRVFIDEPISCYCPTHFTDNQVEYTKKTCWVMNTQYIEAHEAPRNDPSRKDSAEKLVTYYQWIPLFLTLQAILFYTPRFIWKRLNKKSGIAVNNITDGSIDCLRKGDSEESQKTITFLAQYMERFLGWQKQKLDNNFKGKNKLCHLRSTLRGNYLVVVYLAIKALYIANVIGQIFLLNAFLGNDFHMYGIDVVSRLIRRLPWRISYRFPRITRCNLPIRVVDTVHTHKIQCVLPMNLFYEIIFIFIWFWFVFVAAATVGSFIFWLVNSIRMSVQESYIKQRLLVMEKITKDQREEVKTFVGDYLKRDGCFVLRMAAKNSSDLIASELICELWDKYRASCKMDERNTKNSRLSLSFEEKNSTLRRREEAAMAAIDPKY